MNYIGLINNVWELREQGILTVHEADLYLYLVHRSNKLGWKNPFNQPTEIICAVLGINRNALTNRRNKLQQLGLITFKEGSAQKKKSPVYTLCSLKDTIGDTISNTVSDTISDTISDTVDDTYTLNKTKLNQTTSPPLPPQGALFENPDSQDYEKGKRKKREKKELSFDFVDAAFKPAFMRFIEYRKEIGKPFKSQKGVEGCYAELKKLSNNNVQKATLVVQQSISNEYQGLFPLKKNTEPPMGKHEEQLEGFAKRFNRLGNG